MKKLLLFLATLSVLVAPTAWGAGSKTESYVVGAAGDTDGLCKTDPLNPTGLNIGAVCFKNISGKGKLTITDASLMPVAGYYIPLDGSGAAIGSAVDFCGTSSTFAIPSGTSTLIAYIGGPALGPLACIFEGWAGIGTNGTVKLTLT